jgi:putative phosphoribosyl transferase
VRRYRGDRPAQPVRGRVVVLVDDGLATGFTARAAIEVLRRQGARRVVLAVPVAPAETAEEMRGVADDVACLETPAFFMAIGQWYRDFRQTSDEEVAGLLARHAFADAPQGGDDPGTAVSRDRAAATSYAGEQDRERG